MKKVIVYEENPCEECDFCRAFCDGDFEYCQKYGAPTAKIKYN